MVTKLFTAYAGLIAVEEGSIDLDEPAGPERATVRHLLSHTAGYGFSGDAVISPPGKRRIYSNTGIERFADHLATRTGIPFEHYLAEAVLEPLGMRDSELRGSPAFGLHSTVADLGQGEAQVGQAVDHLGPGEEFLIEDDGQGSRHRPEVGRRPTRRQAASENDLRALGEP